MSATPGRGGVAAIAGLVALGACVPPSVLPPPVPAMGDSRRQVGVGATAGPRIGEDCRFERSDSGDWREVCPPELLGVSVPEGMGWYGGEVGDGVELGLTAGVGSFVPLEEASPYTWIDPGYTETTLIVPFIGTYLRIWAVERDGARVGVQLDGGTGWAGVGLPFAMSVSDHVWLYASPYGVLAGRPAVRAPVGVTVDIDVDVRLFGEAQVAWFPLAPAEYFRDGAVRVSAGLDWCPKPRKRNEERPVN